MGAERSVREEVQRESGRDGESRVVRLQGGMRWRATVVARLISEDIADRHESARLVLNLECLSARRRPLRASIAGAASLDSIGDDVLSAVILNGRPSPLGHRPGQLRAKKR